MFSFGIYSYLLTVVIMIMGIVLSCCILKILDMFFQKIVILCCVGFVSCFAILFATVYISNAMSIAMILETAKFEVTADGSIIKIDNNTITYLDNKTNEIKSIYLDANCDKLKPKLDTTLKPGEIRVSTYTSDWGNYQTAVCNPKQ